MYDYDPRYQIGMRSVLAGDPDDEKYEEYIEDTLCVLEDLYGDRGWWV